MIKIIRKYNATWPYFSGFRLLYVFFNILKLITMVAEFAIPLILSKVITSLVEKDIDGLLLNVTLIISLKGLAIIIAHIASRIQLSIEKGVNYNVKQVLFKNLLAIPPYKLKDYNDGKLFNVLTSDSTSVSSFIFTVTNSIFNILTIIGIGIIIFFLSWPLAIVVLLTFPVTYFVNRYYSKKMKKQLIEMHRVSDIFIGFFKNIITSINEIKSLNASEKIKNHFADKTKSVKDTAIVNEKTRLRNLLICKIIEILNYALIMACAAFLVVNDKLILGDFMAFNSYSATFTLALSSIVNLNAILQPNLTVLDRIGEFENTYKNTIIEESEKLYPASPTYPIEFNDINLIINNKDVLKDFSILFKPLALNGVMGANGSGKTTLLNLLMLIYMSNSGSITINNVNINHIQYKFIQENVTYLKQNPTLFHMTLLENLLFFNGSENVTIEEVIDACKKVNLFDDIMCMPQKFDTVLNDNSKLSVGQTQKLQIARALLMNKSIVLLDEVTVNLDHVSRQRVYELLKEQSNNKTIIFISNNELEMAICADTHKIDKAINQRVS